MIEFPRRFSIPTMTDSLRALRQVAKNIDAYGGDSSDLMPAILELEKDLERAATLVAYLQTDSIVFWHYADSIFPIKMEGQRRRDSLDGSSAIFVRVDSSHGTPVEVRVTYDDEAGWTVVCDRGFISPEDCEKVKRVLREGGQWSK